MKIAASGLIQVPRFLYEKSCRAGDRLPNLHAAELTFSFCSYLPLDKTEKNGKIGI